MARVYCKLPDYTKSTVNHFESKEENGRDSDFRLQKFLPQVIYEDEYAVNDNGDGKTEAEKKKGA
jgi:hypothetical protein